MTYAEKAIKVIESQEATFFHGLAGYSEGFTRYLLGSYQSNWIGFADWSIVSRETRGWEAWETTVTMVRCIRTRDRNNNEHIPSLTYKLEEELLSWEQICEKYQTFVRECRGVELDASSIILCPLHAVPIDLKTHD